MITPPYRIVTSRLLIRCYHTEDAPLLLRAISESAEHLKPFMAWANNEPETLDLKLDRIRRFRAKFDRNEDFTYGIFTPEEERLIGGSGLHTRLGGNALEIGYWIHKDYVNRGLATELSAALTRVAFEICGVERMEIHCSVENSASAAIPRKLGYIHEGNRRRLSYAYGHESDQMTWTMFRDEYASSPCAQVELKGYDGAGRQVL